MNIPITKRVMTAGNKKGCGCGCNCECGKTPAKQTTMTSMRYDQKGNYIGGESRPIETKNISEKEFFTNPTTEEKTPPEGVGKMWGAAKVAYGKKKK